jgi:hypothetical protein
MIEDKLANSPNSKFFAQGISYFVWSVNVTKATPLSASTEATKLFNESCKANSGYSEDRE